MPLSLYLLAVAAFSIGTTEFVIMGLLPDVATDLRVSLPQAGLLVTAYALGVVVGAPLLAAVTARFPRRTVLLSMFGLFILGNVGCAVAADFYALMAARIVTAWSHGAFLGTVGVIACQLVAPSLQARANALIFGGITLANVMGVPAGVALGHRFGWRSTFWAVAVLACVITGALITLLPRLPPAPASTLRVELAALKNRRVWANLSLSVANSASLLCLLTFMMPYLTRVLQLSQASATTALFLLGLGLTVGTLMAGRGGDKSLLGTIGVGLGVALVALLALPQVASSAMGGVAVLCVWGMASFGICPVMHTLVMRNAGAAPTLASTLNHSAFNLGNALGAWAGSMALAHGAGLSALPYVGFVLGTVAVGLLSVSTYLQRPFTPRLQPNPCRVSRRRN